jgi:hypothetical protein
MLAVNPRSEVRGQRSGNDEARMTNDEAPAFINATARQANEELMLMLIIVIESQIRGRSLELGAARFYLTD